MPIHDNSVICYHTLDRETRRKMILKAYESFPEGATDRQIMKHLGFSDLNMVRPRITEAINSSYLLEIGDTRCPVTKKSVRMVRLMSGQISFL